MSVAQPNGSSNSPWRECAHRAWLCARPAVHDSRMTMAVSALSLMATGTHAALPPVATGGLCNWHADAAAGPTQDQGCRAQEAHQQKGGLCANMQPAAGLQVVAAVAAAALSHHPSAQPPLRARKGVCLRALALAATATDHGNQWQQGCTAQRWVGCFWAQQTWCLSWSRLQQALGK